MADTTNINDLPGSNNQQLAGVVQNSQQMQTMPSMPSMQSVQSMQSIQPSQQNITMDVTYNSNNVQSTINPQMQQNNIPQIQNQQISQPNMTYSDVVKSLDNKAPETLPLNNGNTMSNILQSMEQIAKSGALDLPSRDIPRQENNIDDKARTNYIPQATNYIEEYEDQEEIMKYRNQCKNKKVSADILFDKLQVPLLLGLLYFLFHLPIVNKWFFKTCKFCFHTDGNMNFNGYIIKSVLFATLYLTVNLGLDVINQQFI